uniref:S1 motif domain-containing protein n=1 Tax=Angiostrongylus cantonensis TaxID=6313 RepID=A0A0K0D4F1_ANGCA
MLVGLVVERYDDELVIYCRSGDYRVSLPEFGAEFEVGTWVGVKVSDDEVEITGILNVDGLPEVRVVCGKAEVSVYFHVVLLLLSHF